MLQLSKKIKLREEESRKLIHFKILEIIAEENNNLENRFDRSLANEYYFSCHERMMNESDYLKSNHYNVFKNLPDDRFKGN
jgi:hypothetical protein